MKISYSESFCQSAALRAQVAGQLAMNSSLVLTSYFSTSLATVPLTCTLSLTFYNFIRRQNPLYLPDRSLSGSQDQPRLNASMNRIAVEIGFLLISVCDLVAISVPYCGCMSLAQFEIFFSAPYLQIALSSKISWRTQNKIQNTQISS